MPPKKRENSYRWLLEPFEPRADFVERPMFGCLAAYLDAKLVIVLADGGEPWEGLLVATSREHHDSLTAEFPSLSPHPVLGKWLYLPASATDFEGSASAIVDLALNSDMRIGVLPKPKMKKRAP